MLAAPTERLRSAIERALSRRRKTLVSVTVPVEGIDPCAAIFASRLASDRWFCWEQPDREFALAALGVVHEVTSRGGERFREVARGCLGIETISDEPPGLPAGAGVVWTGGFAFDSDGGRSSQWSSLPPASLALPELSVCRGGGETFLTVNSLVGPGDDPADKEREISTRLAGLRSSSKRPGEASIIWA